MFEHARRRAWRPQSTAPVLENLEGRTLLSGYTGPSYRRVVHSAGGAFLIEVSGGGVIKVNPPGLGGVNLRAFGTTTSSTITISQIRPRWHYPSRYLVINKLTVTSHQLGELNASAAELNGPITPLTGGQNSAAASADGSSTSLVPVSPLNNTVNTLELGAIGPKAQIDISGNVGVLSVSQVDLGPTGHVVISGQINTTDVTGSLSIGSFTIDGGRFVIGQDSIAPISISGNMTINHDGLFSIGRDLDGALTVNGNLLLDSGGQIFIGRNLTSLSVGGNLTINPTGSGIVVNGQLGSLSVAGVLQGQGGTSAPQYYDVGVGLDLNGLTIGGGTTNLDSLINANIRAGGDISGVDIAYNSVNSTIQPHTPPPT
jgi:hypothetical protein